MLMSGVRSFNHARTMSPYAYLRANVLNVPRRGTYVSRNSGRGPRNEGTTGRKRRATRRHAVVRLVLLVAGCSMLDMRAGGLKCHRYRAGCDHTDTPTGIGCEVSADLVCFKAPLAHWW